MHHLLIAAYPWLLLIACGLHLLNTLLAWEQGRHTRGTGFTSPQALLSLVVTVLCILHALGLIGRSL